MGFTLKKPWKTLRTSCKVRTGDVAPEQSTKAGSSSLRKKIKNVFSRKKPTSISYKNTGSSSSQSNSDCRNPEGPKAILSKSQVLPESPSDIQDALQKQIERLHSIMSIENACQAVGTGDSDDEEEPSLLDTLPIEVKSLVDDLLFPKKDPRLCQLRTLSTDRLQTMFKAGHQRQLSGDTLVGSDDEQAKTSFVVPECPVPNSSVLDSTNVQSEDKEVQSKDEEDQPEDTEVQLEGDETQLYKQLAFYNASLYDSEEERIRAEVGAEWKAAFKAQGRRHRQNNLDNEESFMNDLRRVDARCCAVQREGQRFRHQRDKLLVDLDVVKEERDELKEERDELQEKINLDTYSDENATLREDNARLCGLIEYGRQIGLEKVMGLEYQIQDQELTISTVFQENTELRDELAEVAEEKRFLWSERAADKAALRGLLEQMGPLDEELAEAREELRATKECWARDTETLEEVSEQKYQLGLQLAATVVENNNLKLAAGGQQQQDMQNGWAEGLIHLALQLVARMQSLDTELQRQGLNMCNEERAALMSYCCQTLGPHGVNVSALAADDKALMERAVSVTASPTP